MTVDVLTYGLPGKRVDYKTPTDSAHVLVDVGQKASRASEGVLFEHPLVVSM